MLFRLAAGDSGLVWSGIVAIWVMQPAPAAEPIVVDDFPEGRQKTQTSRCREELHEPQGSVSNIQSFDCL